ncbi:YcxB family protein [Laspinema sp. D1]|uniref:YcxB family protein n=1 Tax=Laspinema palackyanum TaxID=3231601 RepID=UPI0034885E86|nr:YcxB family protein [Laspinema sp. D2b]
MAISLKFTLKGQELEEGLIVRHNSKPYLRFLKILIFMSIVISLFIFLLFFLISNSGIPAIAKKIVLKGLLIGSGFALLSYPILGHKAMISVMDKVATFLKDPVLIQIEESGFSYKNAVRKSKIEWSSIEKVLESKNIFLIIHRVKGYYTLPKRIFTDENFPEFQQILAANHIQIEKIQKSKLFSI